MINEETIKQMILASPFHVDTLENEMALYELIPAVTIAAIDVGQTDVDACVHILSILTLAGGPELEPLKALVAAIHVEMGYVPNYEKIDSDTFCHVMGELTALMCIMHNEFGVQGEICIELLQFYCIQMDQWGAYNACGFMWGNALEKMKELNL